MFSVFPGAAAGGVLWARSSFIICWKAASIVGIILAMNRSHRAESAVEVAEAAAPEDPVPVPASCASLRPRGGLELRLLVVA